MVIYFHIGYPKSASTSLQRDFFPKLKGFKYLGLVPTKNIAEASGDIYSDGEFLHDKDLRDFYDLLINSNIISMDINLLKNLFYKLIEKYKKENRGLIFSHEGLLSARFSNPSIYEKINILKSLINDKIVLNILVITRDQTKILSSLYRDVPHNSSGKIISFDRWVCNDISQKYFSHTLTLRYWSIYKYLKNELPNVKLLFLPLEGIKSNRYTKEMADFFNTDQDEINNLIAKMSNHNSGMSAPAYWFLLLIDKLKIISKIFVPFRIFYRPIIIFLLRFLKNKGHTKKIIISSDVKEKIRDFFLMENIYLSEELNDEFFRCYNENDV